MKKLSIFKRERERERERERGGGGIGLCKVINKGIVSILKFYVNFLH
jgi:hypothetical protein